MRWLISASALLALGAVAVEGGPAVRRSLTAGQDPVRSNPSLAVADGVRRALEGAGPMAAVPSAEAVSLQSALRGVYESRQFAPLWFKGGRPTPASARAIDTLARASTWGLRSKDYGVEEVRRTFALFEGGFVVPDDGSAEAETIALRTAERLARADVDLSMALARFFTHISRGRVEPDSLGYELGPAPDPTPGPLVDLARDGLLDEALSRAEPPSPSYARLMVALAHARQLLDAPALPPLPPLPSSGKVSPGDVSDLVAATAARLRLWGDLPADAEVSDRYEGPVVEAIKRFQSRHGLDPDGVLGRNTMVELVVPVNERIVQLELALERQRWLRRVSASRVVLVNVAAFEAQAYERFADGDPALVMPIVAGNAARTPTPMFTGTLSTVVFRPYWYPPPSILVNEILPALRKDPEYFVKNDFEIVASERDDAPTFAATRENIQRLRTGTLRLRQRPGAKNALGAVKFLFPNRHSVYMHDTPARSLFARPRRDFSHGCIRLGRPLTLADFVLDGSGDWSGARILDASQGPTTLNVTVAHPPQVVVFYSTADVTPDGRTRFFRDIYSLDAMLLAWLDR